MPFQSPLRSSSVLASALAAAGLMLAVAGCSSLTPLGPARPQPRHLLSPIVLQAMRGQPHTATGGCPAGSVAFPAPPGVGIGWQPLSAAPGGPPSPARATSVANPCYRMLGRPVTITSAAISPVYSFHPPTPPGGAAVPVQYGFNIALPAAGAAALTAVTTTASESHGYLDISVSGKIWLIPQVLQPFTNFQIFLASRNQALQLRRHLAPPS